MKIKIFDENTIHFDEIEKKGGFTNLVNDFCSTVSVIDIVVLDIDKIIVKYKVENQKYTVKMIDYEGEPVPEACCTIDRDGEVDDFIGCGNCKPEDDMCSSCVVNEIFTEYAALTNQCN